MRVCLHIITIIIFPLFLSFLFACENYDSQPPEGTPEWYEFQFKKYKVGKTNTALEDDLFYSIRGLERRIKELEIENTELSRKLDDCRKNNNLEKNE